jgi:beta-1,4-mannosyl-glycoprotein beta-1,4-N-acetylglucosaminyltransferase
VKIDAILLNDELDILELRLQTLDSVMDRFVVVESTVEFSGRPKPLYYEENKSKFAAWKDKICHIKVTDTPDSGDNRWAREHFQRNAILRGLEQFKNHDAVFMSDVDEIPDLEAVRKNRHGGYRQVYSMYYVNAVCTDENWVGTTCAYCSEYRHVSPQKVRNDRYVLPAVYPGGWHFAYLMSLEQMHHKLGAFAHAEWDTPQVHAAIEQRVSGLKDLFGAHEKPMQVVDVSSGYFPEYLKNNQSKYSKFIK